MGGGLIQLMAYGAENQYLMGNPQITFFKIVYKRHTNFSMEHIEVPLEGNQELNYGQVTKLRCKIPRHADLINKMYFRCNIPGIRSSEELGVRFIKNLGSTMIKTAELHVGGTKVDTLYGEWIYIYNDLFLTSSKRNAYNVMIGNTESRYGIGTTRTYQSGRGWDTNVLSNLVISNISPSTSNIYSKLRTFTINSSNTKQYHFKNSSSIVITATSNFDTQTTIFTVTCGSDHGLTSGDIIKFDGAGYYAMYASIADSTITTGANHFFKVNDKVKYTKGSGTGITGLTDGDFYYIETVPEDNKIKLSQFAGGDALTISGGSETNKFTTATKYGTTTASEIIKTGDKTFTFTTNENVRTNGVALPLDAYVDANSSDLLLHYYVDYTTANHALDSKSAINSSLYDTKLNMYVTPPWQINVPLNFWFTKNPGLSIPLIALQYHEIEVELELRAIEDLYQIKETNTTSNFFGKYIKPDRTNIDHKIENFSIMKNFILNAPNTGRANINKPGWGLSPIIEVKYIYLDTEERKLFANMEHEYLIEQIVKNDVNGIVGEKTFEVKLYHPIKELIIVTKRDDMENVNEWTNFTNAETVLQANNSSVNINHWNKCVYTPVGKNIVMHHDNIVEKGFSDILINMEVKMNGLTRQGNRYYSYYKYVQPYEAHNFKAETRGIYVYSFSLNNESYQPSGSINASRVNKIEFSVKTRIPYEYSELLDNTTFPSNGETYLWKYNFVIYSVNYNVLRISGGMGSIQFAN